MFFQYALQTKETREMSDDATANFEFLQNAVAGVGRYRSCKSLEGSLFVERGKIKACCMQNIGNAESPVLATFSSVTDSSDLAVEVIKARNRLRIANQTNRAPCNGCYQLKESEWIYSHKIGWIAIGGFLHCNLACGYCTSYAHDPTDRGAGLFKLLGEWFRQGIIGPGSGLDFGGGEPTLHQEFAEIADFAFSNAIRMRISSNCTIFSDAISRGLELGLATVVCSIDAGTPITYSQIKGKDFFDKVWNVIMRYAAAQNTSDKVVVKYIVMDQNCGYSELDSFVTKLRQSGARRLIISANADNNPQSHGILGNNILEGIGYLATKAQEQDIAVELADIFSSDSIKLIDARTTEISNRHNVQATGNIEGLVEISFMDNITFLNRVVLGLTGGYPFKVLFTRNYSIESLPQWAVATLNLVIPRPYQESRLLEVDCDGVTADEVFRKMSQVDPSCVLDRTVAGLGECMGRWRARLDGMTGQISSISFSPIRP